jgi:hypothetical protein
MSCLTKWCRPGAFAAAFTGFFAISHALVAYEMPLEPHSIREAYFLGQRNDEKMAKVLELYTRHLPLPEKGPYISEIKLLTPYAQVVDVSRQRTVGYSAQQAEQDYRERGDTIVVFVRIEFTATYSYLQAVASANRVAAEEGITLQTQDFWKDFRLGLSQHNSWVEPFYQQGEPFYTREYGGGLAGAVVWLEYNAHDVASAEASVEVFAPGGEHRVAKFDLEKLK